MTRLIPKIQPQELHYKEKRTKDETRPEPKFSKFFDDSYEGEWILIDANEKQHSCKVMDEMIQSLRVKFATRCGCTGLCIVSFGILLLCLV